jgi:hypothetical protein
VDPVPVNDLFSGAIAIPMIGGSYGTSTDSADLEPNEFTPQGCPGPGKTLWYKFTPTGSDANVTLSTQYSSFDTTMNVWSGTALTDLQYVACNNDVDGSNNWSRTTFRAHLGQTYYVQVGGYFGVHGYLYLDAKVDPVPANDDFANATLLTSGPHEGTLTNASVQPNEPVATNCAVTSRTAWFKLVPLVDTWVDVAIPGTAPGTTLTAYKGSSLTGLTPVGCATPPGNVTNYDPVLSFPTAAGQTYYLQLGAIPSSTFAYFDIDVSLATIPTSDHFASAETIGFDADGYASGGIYDMDHLGLDAGEPQPAGCTASAHTAWLKYTPTENADMHAGAYFPGLGTLTVWRGTSLNALTKVACLTTTTANGQAEIPFAALAGQTYYVQVGPTTGSMVIMDWWANFTPHTGNGLTVVPAGTGTGTVTSDVGGIYCGSVCGAILDPATQVVLTAYPAYGSTFSGWSGACSGTGTCGVSMSAERTVTATFADVPATAVITAPTMPTAQTVVAFNQSVHGVSASNVRLVPTGSSTPVSATVTCVNASAAAVSCATGPARSARLTTTSPLMPGGSYTAIVNPAGASPIRDAANTIVPTVTKAVRTLTVQAESLPSTPAWGTVSASGSAFGGSYTTERLAGAAQTWSFTGTSVTWWTLRNRAQGKAGIYIDGVFNATVSNYLNSSTTGYRYGRTYAGLTNTPHTIEVRVLGQVGATVAGAGTYVSVDAFSTGTAGCSLTTTIATCSATPGSKYKWASTTSTSPAYTGLTTDILGATMSLTFRGTGVDVCRVLASDQGKMTVQVDGGALTTLDNYAATRTITGSAIYAIRGLTSGQHTVKLRVLHQPHTGATGTRITIDKWRVV